VYTVRSSAALPVALVGALVACSPGLEDVEQPIEVEVYTRQLTKSGGTLVVQTTHDDDLSVSLPDVEVAGLELQEGTLSTESLGERTVLTQTFPFTGAPGFYEVPPLVVTGTRAGAEPVEGQSRAVWIDLGKEAPNAEKIGDITEPAAVWVIPWGWLVGGCTVAGMMVGGFVVAFASVLRRPRESVERLEPPDVRCLRAWEAVREDYDLTDEEKAKELSRIFREYVQEVLQFPAAAWTTTEILERLESMAHLPKGNVPRAKGLLRATDLVKYADVSPESDFFDDLDADLRAFVSSTRPRSWEQGDASQTSVGPSDG
jgi:hypothetical protein